MTAELSDINLSNDQKREYRHATLFYFRSKRGEIDRLNLSYSRVYDSYFRSTRFTAGRFVGTVFDRCNFRGSTFEGCDFEYASFFECDLDINQIVDSLPDKPNLRSDLLRKLYANATRMGDKEQARKIRLMEIDATKEHLRLAWKGEGTYYRSKYKGFQSKLAILGTRLNYWLDDLLWGHGEKLWRIALFGSALLLATATFQHFFLAERLISNMKTTGLIQFTKVLSAHFELFLGLERRMQVDIPTKIAVVLVSFRYVVFGMVIAALYRRTKASE